jgi:drug/metabolite transporter (DMT)-like permease
MRIAAILLVALGVTFFAIIDSLAKHLEPDYSVLQIVWARYVFAVPVILAFARPATWLNLLQSQQVPMQIGRALLPLLASIVVVFGLAKIPLAEFTAISFAAPLLVVALSAPLLKERITIHSWIGVLLGFLGVVVIVRPGGGVISWAAIFPLVLALFFALYQITTRLVSRGDGPMVTLAWTIAVGLVLTTPLLPFAWRPVSGTGMVPSHSVGHLLRALPPCADPRFRHSAGCGAHAIHLCTDHRRDGAGNRGVRRRARCLGVCRNGPYRACGIVRPASTAGRQS